MRTLLIAAAATLAAGGALAHAQLESASPPVGGAVAPPREIRLTFSEAVEPAFSKVALSGPRGALPLGKRAVAAGNARTLIVEIPKPLAPGAYTVTWRAVSVDTHTTQGEYAFTVK